MKRLLLVASAAAALSACATGGGLPLDVVTRTMIEPNYDSSSVSVFAASGGATTILGSTRDGASPDEIAAALRLPAHLAQRTVHAAPTGEAQNGPHLVLVFAPQSAASARDACRGEVSGGVAGSPLKVFGAFCSSYGTPASEALFTAAGSPTPSDPDFGKRLSVLMSVLMPAVNPDQGEGRSQRVP
ncbi:hypothetical protein [Pikeienuella sp. HZG-20]|uniref:hypothetical protein n=1 Tax=Paludibacillus litoralis TaxID=3133267 RepID=UPI0030EBC9D3